MNDEEMKEFERLLAGSSVGGAPMDPTAPAREYSKLELEELLAEDDPAPAELRRIAELTELLHSDEAAWPWWQRAARAKDPDAVAYLLELISEAEDPE